MVCITAGLNLYPYTRYVPRWADMCDVVNIFPYNQYFTKVKRDSEKWGAGYAAPHFSGFFQLFRDLLIMSSRRCLDCLGQLLSHKGMIWSWGDDTTSAIIPSLFYAQSTSPCRRAMTAAWVRSVTPNLAKIALT